jgi:hypothetical protein
MKPNSIPKKLLRQVSLVSFVAFRTQFFGTVQVQRKLQQLFMFFKIFPRFLLS